MQKKVVYTKPQVLAVSVNDRSKPTPPGGCPTRDFTMPIGCKAVL